MMRQSHHKRGFSLVELLVVVGIVGVLIALLLPGIQKIREAANRIKCGNNLKQQGIALHLFNDVNGHFPPSYVNPAWNMGYQNTDYYTGAVTSTDNASPANSRHNHTGFMLLLPFLEQSNLYQKFNRNAASADATVVTLPSGPNLTILAGGGVSPENQTVVSTSISTYVCPSETNPDTGPDTWTVTHAGQDVIHPENYPFWCTRAARSNYRFSVFRTWFALAEAGDKWLVGDPDTDPPDPGWLATDGIPATQRDHVGMFGINTKTRMADITDGSSNTIAIGESKQETVPGGDWGIAYGIFTYPMAPWKRLYTHWGAGHQHAVDGAMHFTFAPSRNLIGGLHINFKVKDTPIFSNPYDPGDPRGELQNHLGFGSWHQGGANFVFGDGSVRFLTSRNTAFPVFASLGSMNGGEPQVTLE